MKTIDNVMIPRKSVASNQDVQIALVLNKGDEDDPTNAWALANNEALSPSAGAVVWYLATGKQQSDTFFAHGGFFSPLTAPIPTDVGISITNPASSTQLGAITTFTVTATYMSGAHTPLLLSLPLPDNVEYVNIPDERCAYASPSKLIACSYELGPTLSSVTLSIDMIATGGTVMQVTAFVNPLNPDTSFSNNKSTKTLTLTP